MSEGDNASPYLDPYRDAVRESGAGFESQLWLSKNKQQTRFRVITAMAQPKGRVLADIGAGIAEYLPYLHEHDALPKHYIGVEGVPEMTEEGRRRAETLGISGAVFETHDFVADETLAKTLVQDAGVDTFVFSGSLNTLDPDAARVVLDRVYDALAAAGRGTIVFNFLSQRKDTEPTPPKPPAVRFDPVGMLNWALTRTPLVRLAHDYMDGHDATIRMRVPEAS